MAKASLPVDNPTLPFWLTERSSLDEIRTTPEIPSQSDIVIIGAGYAGISLAYHLLNLDSDETGSTSITVLEARTVCSGATGRNGGHVRPDTYSLMPLYIQRHGQEAAREVAEFELAHIEAIQGVIHKEGINDCDLFLTKNTNVYFDEDRATSAKHAIESLRQQGCKFVDQIQFIPAEKIETESGVKGAKIAFTIPAGSIWPYKFIMGLLRAALNRGDTPDRTRLNVQTRTPVTSVTTSSSKDEDEYKITVTTPRGTIKAKKVVYTTNAYTFGLLPEYERAIIPARGIVAHIDIPPDLKEMPLRLSQTYVLNTDSEIGTDYLIVRPDGSIVVGGAHQIHTSHGQGPLENSEWYGNIDDGSLIENTKEYFDGYMQRYFTGWERSGAYVKELWTGIMGYSADSAPHIGAVPGRRNQYIAAGFNGHGMPVIFLATKELAKVVLHNKPIEETQIPRIYRTSAERLAVVDRDEEGGDILRG